MCNKLIYAEQQILQKLIYLHLPTDCFMKKSSWNSLQANANKLTSVISVHKALHWALYHVIPKQIWIISIITNNSSTFWFHTNNAKCLNRGIGDAQVISKDIILQVICRTISQRLLHINTEIIISMFFMHSSNGPSYRYLLKLLCIESLKSSHSTTDCMLSSNLFYQDNAKGRNDFLYVVA